MQEPCSRSCVFRKALSEEGRASNGLGELTSDQKEQLYQDLVVG
jgi:hypothetical protein